MCLYILIWVHNPILRSVSNLIRLGGNMDLLDRIDF